MKNYVLIPNSINDIQNIHSHYLKSFFQTVKVEDNKFPLDSIRKLYVEDRDKFIKVIDELTLRGFQFFTGIPNNILPSFSCDVSNFITVSSNKNNYKNLSFQHFDLSGFNHRFQVDSDLFFHQIPIQCFQYINASVDVKELENEFREAGFTVTSVDSDQSQVRLNTVDISKRSVNSTNSTYNDFTERNSETYFIDNIFQENKYNSFRDFCYENNIDSVQDITKPLLKEYKNSKGIGMHRYQIVLEQLETYGFTDLQEGKNRDEEFIFSPDNPFVSVITIMDSFYENKHKRFREFCSEVGIVKISEIKYKHFETFSSLPGVGNRRVDALREKLQSLSDEVASVEKNLFSVGDLYPYIKNTQIIDLLKMFKIEMEVSSNMIVSDLEGKDLREIEQFNNSKHIYQLSYELQKLSNPEKILNNVKSQLKERDLVILNMRFLKDNTLEETGHHLEITRERVRQLETKMIKKIVRFLQANRFQFIITILNNKPFISYEEVLDVIGEVNRNILELFKEKNVVLHYAEELDTFFLDIEKKENFINRLEGVIEELPETFNLKDYENVLEDILRTNHDLNLNAILEYYGYNQYGTLYSLNKLTIINVIELIFQYYIHEPIKLDESSVEIIKEFAEKYFDYNVGDSLRSIEGRMRDSENIILVDKSTFQWFDPETINQDLIGEIRDYIMKQFETREVINVEEIYQDFEDKLTSNQILNKFHLYSLIKFFLDEDFSIGKGNTLNIYRENKNKLNSEDRLITTIRSLGGTCSRDQLEKDLRWPRYKIDLAISSSNQIITWGKNTVKLFDSLLTNEEKKELIQVVETNMENGYSTSSIIYEQMMFNKKLAPLIQKKEINSSIKISSIVKNIMPSVKGHQHFLYTEASEFTTFEDVIVDHFKGETSRSAIQSFILEHGYKDLMVSNFLESIVKRGYFFEIDLGVYYPSDKFNISEDVVQSLIEFIENKMGDREYISLSNVEGYRSALPAIDFRWNSFLMKSILVKNGYRQIEKNYNDYRYDMNILVLESSTIKTFEELTYFILKDQYDGNMHETAVYDFIADKGLLRKKDYGKTLPYEIRSKSNLIQVNEIGIVKLK